MCTSNLTATAQNSKQTLFLYLELGNEHERNKSCGSPHAW